MVAPVTVSEIEPERTYELRRDVLRPGASLDEMALFGDDGPGTGVFGAVDTETGEVLCTANVRREQPPEGLAGELSGVAGTTAGESADAWRLRGMATREHLRGRGLGALVLEAAVRHVAVRGGGLLWCNARVGAVRFYERAGFVVWGDEFESVGVRHVVMWRIVDAKKDEAGK